MAEQDIHALQAEIEINDAIALGLLLRQGKKRRRKTRSVWVDAILLDRRIFGTYFHLFPQLSLNDKKFKEYFRLSREQFRQVLFHVEADLMKANIARECISPRERLAICIRYLATGESYRSLAMQYRIGLSTLSSLIPEVCQVIWDKMSPIYLKFPQSSDDWKLISENFMYEWQFPNCLGALDGKHIVMKCPDNSGSTYFNYKGTMSLVLLALVDANLKFIYVDIGGYGRNSDGGIYAQSTLGKGVASGKIHIPNDAHIAEAPQYGKLPYVIVADEAFPLGIHLMRPYPGRSITREERVFNYRLSRARRIVECAFGILAARWRLYHTKIAIKPENVKTVVKATVVLHNFLQSLSTPAELTCTLEDEYESETESLKNLRRSGHNCPQDALAVREKLKEYVNAYKLPWQDKHIDRGLNLSMTE